MNSKLVRFCYVINTGIYYLITSMFRDKAMARGVLYKRLLSLGGIYVKFLQILVIRDDHNDLMFSGLKNTLGVFDQLPYEKIEIQKLLEEELGDEALKINLSSHQPFAAGSFAQVYSATLEGGQVAVIKVLRPSVIKFLKFDLKMLAFLRSVISLTSSASMINSKIMLQEFKNMTLQETNYLREVTVAVRLAKQYENNPVIHIPKTYKDLSTTKLIIQERINGLPLTDLLADAHPNIVQFVKETLNTDLNYVMEVLAEEFLVGSLGKDGTHGDPHPGNIYLLGDNKVALIDFGIVSVARRNQQELIELIREYSKLYSGIFKPDDFAYAMIKYYVPTLARSFETLATFTGKEDLTEELLNELVKESVGSLSNLANRGEVDYLLSEYRMSILFTKVINKGNRFSLEADIHEIAFLRSIQIFLNMIGRLGCDKQILRRSWERVSTTYNAAVGSGVISYDNESIDKSIHWIAEWFEKLHYSNPALYYRIEDKMGSKI